MRKAVVLFLLLAVTAPLISQTNSSDLASVLTQILDEYDQISLMLDTQLKSLDQRLTASEQSMTAFALSFDSYRKVVDEKVMPRLATLERQNLFLKIGLGGALVAVIAEAVVLLVRR